MGASGSKFELSPQNRDSLLAEYHAAGGVSAKNETAGWTDNELRWLLTVFASRCTQLKVYEEKDEEESSKSKSKSAKKEKKKQTINLSLSTLELQREVALKHIVIFNQSFVNYPSLADRFWRLLDVDGDGCCCFTEYTQLMHKIVRGTWEQRTSVAFAFFKSDKSNFISKEGVIAAVTEISEFICNVARGLLNMNEFNSLKLAKIEDLFSKQSLMTLDQFTEAAEHHQSLLGCAEILDMVFGRVIRKMEMDMKKDRVFGRYLQETALGNVKDISGDMPFVPEVIASSIYYLRKYNALNTPELFRISVANSIMTQVKLELNMGVTVKSYFQRYSNPGTDEFMLLASLIKTYCFELLEPAFTVEASRKIIEAQESIIDEQEKLKIFQQIFASLPTPNRYFLGSLFPFLKEVSDAQIASGGDKCMSSSNLGVVFAPCTLYDPKDPTYGATSAPNAFRVFIDNCNNFEPGKVRPKLIRKQSYPRPVIFQ